MNPLTRELEITQNPALGAAILWRYTIGYCPEDQPKINLPFHFLFLALPLVMNETTLNVLKRTNKSSGLMKFEAKFSDPKFNEIGRDELLAIHDRAFAQRELTMRSLNIAISCGLLVLDVKDGIIWPSKRTGLLTSQPENTKLMLRVAEQLGAWLNRFSNEEIATILKVKF